MTSFPDTSDRRADESSRDYWDRKRRERHGPGCQCYLCIIAGDNPLVEEDQCQHQSAS